VLLRPSAYPEFFILESCVAYTTTPIRGKLWSTREHYGTITALNHIRARNLLSCSRDVPLVAANLTEVVLVCPWGFIEAAGMVDTIR